MSGAKLFCSRDGFLHSVPLGISGNVRFLPGCSQPFFAKSEHQMKEDVLVSTNALQVDIPMDTSLCVVQEKGYAQTIRTVPFVQKVWGHRIADDNISPSPSASASASPFVRVPRLVIRPVTDMAHFRIQVFSCTQTSVVRIESNGLPEKPPLAPYGTDAFQNRWSLTRKRPFSDSFQNDWGPFQEILIENTSIKSLASADLRHSVVAYKSHDGTYRFACAFGEDSGRIKLFTEDGGGEVEVPFQDVLFIQKKRGTRPVKSTYPRTGLLLVQIHRLDLVFDKDPTSCPIVAKSSILNSLSSQSELIPIR